jgi:hypothetical protein
VLRPFLSSAATASTGEQKMKVLVDTDDALRKAPMWKTDIPGWLADADTIKPPRTPGAFLHLGKTGGSSLSRMLRNGCHSFVAKPCRGLIPKNESYISQLTTYYHTPDFHKLNKTAYSFYIISLRDPLDRTLSAFTFMHPANQRARGERRIFRGSREFFEPCFPDLDTFVEAIDSTIKDKDTITDQSNCTHLATGALQNRFESLTNHFTLTPSTWNASCRRTTGR